MLQEAACQRVLENLHRTLLSLRGDSSGTYYYRPVDVVLGAVEARELAAFPVYCMFPTAVNIERRLPNKRYQCSVPLIVWGFHRSSVVEERLKHQTRMARDIIRVLDADPHRGLSGTDDDCWDTVLQSVRFTSLSGTPIVRTELRYNCPYRFKDGAI